MNVTQMIRLGYSAFSINFLFLQDIYTGHWGFKWLLEPSGTQLINTHVSTVLQSL